METVIGLGAAGCRIADAFAQYPQYTTYKIDNNLKGDNCFSLQPKLSPEDYERNVPDMSVFFQNIEGDILFVVGGGGKISGATLQILKQARVNNINLLYIKPYSKALTKTGLLQDRAAFYILQEYARSGLFANIYLVDNTLLENIIGEVPILEYNKKLNEVIVNAFHYINIFKNSEPLLQNMESPNPTQRINTLGIYDISNNEEKIFFSLQNVGYKCYYYAIPEQVLKSDGKLFKIIKDKAAENQSSYQIHTTKHAESFAYFIAQSGFIQSVDKSE